ncbi:MAG: hypothetical protein MUF67_14070, partial [Desulfobacterales bacterium]|nr:hypothetical protein [Desulfobacterales bacterium]
MRMVIQAWEGKVPRLDLATEAADYAFACLARVARHLAVLKRRPGPIDGLPPEPLAREMIASVRAVGDADLTPLAAVAGTLADAVADRLFGQGLSRVIVDNGGDIAIRLAAGETTRVGLRPEIAHPEISHVLTLDGRHSTWGVATVARSASLADAAATAVANACLAAGADVLRVPAAKLDPNTDIPDLLVTVAVGDLTGPQRAEALSNALQRAEGLTQRGVIRGALAAVGKQVGWTADLPGRVAGLVALA